MYCIFPANSPAVIYGGTDSGASAVRGMEVTSVAVLRVLVFKAVRIYTEEDQIYHHHGIH